MLPPKTQHSPATLPALTMNWRRLHPSQVPRVDWLARMETIRDASPYLLPEWSQFWEDVWPRSRAEVFENDAFLIPLVTRHRYGLTWQFAQPFGTDCIVGNPDDVDWIFLASEMTQRRTVEMAICADISLSISGWTRFTLTQKRWVINARGKTYSEVASGFSGSHRRNLAKGEELQLRLDATTDSSRLIRLWKDQHREPRFMLNPRHAQALIARFAPVGALVWHTAWAGERPVAGTIFIVHKNVAVSIDTIVDRDTQFRGAGHFLVAQTIQSLIDSGVSVIDLGGVPGGAEHAGLDEFKSGWNAAQAATHTTLYRRNWYSAVRRLQA